MEEMTTNKALAVSLAEDMPSEEASGEHSIEAPPSGRAVPMPKGSHDPRRIMSVSLATDCHLKDKDGVDRACEANVSFIPQSFLMNRSGDAGPVSEVWESRSLRKG